MSATLDEKHAAPTTAITAQTRLPEWEHTAAQSNSAPPRTKTPLTTNFKARYQAVVGSRSGKRWCGVPRRIALLLLLAILLILLAIIIGLAVGLTRKRAGLGSSSDLPLPGNTQTFQGQLTYYGTGLGACGVTSTDSDDIVSVSHIIFDAAGSSSSTGGNSNNNPLCGRKLRATRYDSSVGQQRSVDLTVVDRCTGCAAVDLDTTIGVFGELADIAQGRVDVSWAWL